jgi:hypothetical protein
MEHQYVIHFDEAIKGCLKIEANRGRRAEIMHITDE